MREKIQSILKNAEDFADAFNQPSNAYQATSQLKEDFVVELIAALAFEVSTSKRIADWTKA